MAQSSTTKAGGTLKLEELEKRYTWREFKEFIDTSGEASIGISYHKSKRPTESKKTLTKNKVSKAFDSGKINIYEYADVVEGIGIKGYKPPKELLGRIQG